MSEKELDKLREEVRLLRVLVALTRAANQVERRRDEVEEMEEVVGCKG